MINSEALITLMVGLAILQSFCSLFFCDHENANEIWCKFWVLLICIIYVHCDIMLLYYKEDSKQQQQPHSNIVSFTITFMADWTLHKGGEKMCPVIAPR